MRQRDHDVAWFARQLRDEGIDLRTAHQDSIACVPKDIIGHRIIADSTRIETNLAAKTGHFVVPVRKGLTDRRSPRIPRVAEDRHSEHARRPEALGRVGIAARAYG